MADSSSSEVDPEKQKEKRQRTDINERVLTDPFRLLSTEKAMSISMVGRAGAGKTTILYKLCEDEDKVAITSSGGCRMETLVYDNITLNAWDVSGEHKTRLKGIDLKDTKGLIFVVDSTARDTVDRARDELHMLLNEELLKDVVLLVFANKEDLPDRMNKTEVTERLGLSSHLRQRHCRVLDTCATTGAGLYKGLHWLSKRIKHTCDVSCEGVSNGLAWLANSSANKNYDDMPTGYTSKPTDEELVDILDRLNNGEDISEDISPDRVAQVNIFDNHPAVIIRNSDDLLPCMLDTCKYYLFHCKVPGDSLLCALGYQNIQDQANGVWEPISYAFVFPCVRSDGTEVMGGVQRFRYKPLNETTSSWRMDMYCVPDVPRPQPDLVLCKVFESANSENAVAMRRIAAHTREVRESLCRRSAHRAKIKLLEAAMHEERTKEENVQVELGGQVQRLVKEVQNYDRDEHKEADAIDPPNRERTS